MAMRQYRWLWSLWVSLLVGCASIAPYTQLPEAEQGLYRVYRNIMTSGQLRTYLSLPTATERAAYAKQVGAAQILEALPEAERTAVLNGQPFEGMSKQALLLLWGTPYLQEGPDFDERWWYYGNYFTLPERGSDVTATDTAMEVALAQGKVVWWQERVPSERNRFPFQRRFLNSPGD
jgi:hypothetical protein